ncbi:MAG: hypothetical protein V1855_02205 [bacterium]
MKNKGFSVVLFLILSSISHIHGMQLQHEHDAAVNNVSREIAAVAGSQAAVQDQNNAVIKVEQEVQTDSTFLQNISKLYGKQLKDGINTWIKQPLDKLLIKSIPFVSAYLAGNYDVLAKKGFAIACIPLTHNVLSFFSNTHYFSWIRANSKINRILDITAPFALCYVLGYLGILPVAGMFIIKTAEGLLFALVANGKTSAFVGKFIGKLLPFIPFVYVAVTRVSTIKEKTQSFFKQGIPNAWNFIKNSLKRCVTSTKDALDAFQNELSGGLLD